MKKLLLMRHAKAASDELFASDESRSLTDRGRENALQISQHMARNGEKLDVVFCSTALRTRQTLDRVEESAGVPLKTEYMKELYLASAGQILGIINDSVPDSATTCLIIGHNPGMHVIAQELAASGDKEMLKALRYNFPTAAVAAISFDVKSWRDITPASGKLDYYIYPKML
jgi:phosphohistidine phosphatase